MAKLDPLFTFVEVVRAGSFAAAAARLGKPRSTVSLHVKTLEAALGTRLMKRSTRSLSLTEDGRLLFDQAEGGLKTLTAAMDTIRTKPGRLSGLIRLTAPADFPTDMLTTAITEFRRMHPAVRFDVMLTSATMNMIDGDVDIALRISGRGGEDRVERRLLDIGWQFCASSEWVHRKGKPLSVGEIDDFIAPAPELRQFLERTVLGGTRLPESGVIADNQLMIRDLVLAGNGVALLPEGLSADAIDDGRVMTFLDEAIVATTPLTLTFPSRADIVPRVRAFADHFAAQFERSRKADECLRRLPDRDIRSTDRGR